MELRPWIVEPSISLESLNLVASFKTAKVKILENFVQKVFIVVRKCCLKQTSFFKSSQVLSLVHKMSLHLIGRYYFLRHSTDLLLEKA